MTKKELITGILKDMYKYNSKNEVDRRWKAWLNRQDKATLETIWNNRNCGLVIA